MTIFQPSLIKCERKRIKYRTPPDYTIIVAAGLRRREEGEEGRGVGIGAGRVWSGALETLHRVRIATAPRPGRYLGYLYYCNPTVYYNSEVKFFHYLNMYVICNKIPLFPSINSGIRSVVFE